MSFDDYEAAMRDAKILDARFNESASQEEDSCFDAYEESLREPEAENVWGEPQPIPSGLLPVETFTPDLLPESLRGWVEDISERMQCPPDFAAVGTMVALSSVIGRKACIQPKRHDDWSVIPNLWGVVVGRPGVMKSPALSESIKPLERLAKSASDVYAEQLAAYEVDRVIDELADKDDKDKANKLIKKGKHDEAKHLLQQSKDIPSLEAPVLRRYKVIDATYESLGQILIDNPFGVLAYRDELTGLLRSLDKDGQEGARAFYLQAYDGNQSYTFDRVVRGQNLTIPAVCLSMLGGIQPGKLQSYIHQAVCGGSGDDGLLQRFGMLVWPDLPTGWRNVDKFPDSEAKHMAYDVFLRLNDMEPGTCELTNEPAPMVFKFSTEAQDTFDAWRHTFENDLRNDNHHPAMESHLAKYRKLVPAIALVCALADGESAVGNTSLIRALGWAEYLQSHAERAYAAGIRPATEGAVALLKKIQSGAVVAGFKPSDVYLKGWSHLSTSEAVNSAAKILVELGYLQEVVKKRPEGGRPSVSYLINPCIKVGSN